MEQLRNEVQQIFRDVFDNEGLVLRDDMTANDVEGWDSLTHLNLVVALEKRLGIKFSTAEITHLKDDDQNVGLLLSLVGSKKSS